MAAPALRRGGRWPAPVSYVYGARGVGGVRVVEEACIARGTDAQVRAGWGGRVGLIRTLTAPAVTVACLHGGGGLQCERHRRAGAHTGGLIRTLTAPAVTVTCLVWWGRPASRAAPTRRRARSHDQAALHVCHVSLLASSMPRCPQVTGKRVLRRAAVHSRAQKCESMWVGYFLGAVRLSPLVSVCRTCRLGVHSWACVGCRGRSCSTAGWIGLRRCATRTASCTWPRLTWQTASC